MKIRKHTRRIIFHHSLSHGGNADAIRDWHLAKGWEEIGYHFVITTDGMIENGRPVKYVGAHAAGRNSDSIGVCLIGDFRYEEPTIHQLRAVVRLIHNLSHTILPGVVHPLKIEFHRPHIFNIFESADYGRFDACPGRKLDRIDFMEIAMRGYQ